MSTMVTMNVGASPFLELNVDISTTSLNKGHHTLTVQIKDDNDIWSIPYSKTFYQNGDLIQYEYWFDDDITASTVQSTPTTDFQEVNADIDVSSLSPGMHKITIRSLSNNGDSSVPYTSYFKNSGGDLVSWQYWFDDNVSTTIEESMAPPQNMLNLMDDLDVSSLSDGSHTVTWRCKDANSNWSVPITYAFDLILGLTDISGLQSVLIYPTPTRSQLSIKIETDTNVKLDVEILNQHGQVISSYQNGISSVNSLMTMDVSKLAAGVYFLRLSSAEKSTTQKFVKQ